jgi:hypothetical protein
VRRFPANFFRADNSDNDSTGVAPARIAVGVMLMESVRGIDFADPNGAGPAFVTPAVVVHIVSASKPSDRADDRRHGRLSA